LDVGEVIKVLKVPKGEIAQRLVVDEMEKALKVSKEKIIIIQ
jgi:hypothetical protein